jgi:hypothetical protein
MDVPFIYGKLAFEPDFTDREDDLQWLLSNFDAGNNTILISPRRWGKSSLVAKAISQYRAKNKEVVCCSIDLFAVRTEEEFYKLFAEELLKATQSSIEKIQEALKSFLGKFIPRVSYGIDGINDMSIGLDWKEVVKSPDQILNLPEKIAQQKNIRIIICIDEFQNIAVFDEHLAFQKKLRSCWQRQKNSSYCLYGSKRHMMLDVFTKPSMPFYKFGDMLFMEKIKEEYWVKFIVKRYADTGKVIGDKLAAHIAFLVDNHPHYVQQLAQKAWLFTTKVCNEMVVEQAHDSLMRHLSGLFQMITDALSNTQINLLQAVVSGEQQYNTKDVIEKYKLSSSANVARAKNALVGKEVLDVVHNKLIFLDPVYSAWLKKYYFKMK